MSSFCYPLIVKAFLFSFEVIVLSLLKVKTNLAFQKSEGVSENPDSGIWFPSSSLPTLEPTSEISYPLKFPAFRLHQVSNNNGRTAGDA